MLRNQNQHFVPESFLKEFTGDDNHFYELNFKHNYIQRRHPNNVCYITNFYDVHDEKILKKFGLDDPRFIETNFQYEKQLPKILKKIKDRQKYLDKKEFETIVDAYLSIKYRSSYFRKKISDPEFAGPSYDQTIRNVKFELSDLLEKNNFDFDSLAATIKQEMLSDSDGAAKTHLSGLISVVKKSNPAVRDATLKILGLNMSIIHAGPNDYFFTSDNPGFTLNGFQSANTNYAYFDVIYFPINSKQMIMFDKYDSLNLIRPLKRLHYGLVPSHFVRNVNLQTKHIADERIFCENKTYLEAFKNSL